MANRKIATIDGLLAAIKRKLGPEAAATAGLSVTEAWAPGYTSQMQHWNCSARVRDNAGNQVSACASGDTAEQALSSLINKLATASLHARMQTQTGIGNRSRTLTQTAAAPRRLSHNGK